MSNRVVYVVVEYDDYRKEVEFEVKRVFSEKEKAIDWAKSRTTLENDPGPEYIAPSGDVVYDAPVDESYARRDRLAILESYLDD